MKALEGDNQLLVFHLLEQLATIADTPKISEGALYVILTSFLEGTAGSSFEVARTARGSSSRPITSWTSEVNYLLERYASDEIINDAMDSDCVEFSRKIGVGKRLF